jgi:hypothetical protein
VVCVDASLATSRPASTVPASAAPALAVPPPVEAVELEPHDPWEYINDTDDEPVDIEKSLPGSGVGLD